MTSRHVHTKMPSKQTIHIIASCTQGKTRHVPPEFRLRDIAGGSLLERLSVWTSRLQQGGGDRIGAIDLYKGPHWAVVRELPAIAKEAGFQAELWVASAGYGLLQAMAKLLPYSATFARSQCDSVWRPGDGDRRAAARGWWSGLQLLSGTFADSPQSLTALAGSAPAAILLVIASPSYLMAMIDDLEGALLRLADPQHLVIISSRSRQLPGWIAPHVVPSEAPLSRVLGGSLGSLHARTARRILQESAEAPLRADVLVPRYSAVVSQQGSTRTWHRRALLDDEVREFIREGLMENEACSSTAMLRKLRGSGEACEQRRFAGLYAEVARSTHVA